MRQRLPMGFYCTLPLHSLGSRAADNSNIHTATLIENLCNSQERMYIVTRDTLRLVLLLEAVTSIEMHSFFFSTITAYRVLTALFNTVLLIPKKQLVILQRQQR